MAKRLAWLYLRDVGVVLRQPEVARSRAAAPSREKESAEVVWASDQGALLHHLLEVFPARTTDWTSRGWTPWRDYVSRLAWERLGVPWRNLKGRPGLPYSVCSLVSVKPKDNAWMDETSPTNSMFDTHNLKDPHIFVLLTFELSTPSWR